MHECSVLPPSLSLPCRLTRPPTANSFHANPVPALKGPCPSPKSRPASPASIPTLRDDHDDAHVAVRPHAIDRFLIPMRRRDPNYSPTCSQRHLCQFPPSPSRPPAADTVPRCGGTWSQPARTTCKIDQQNLSVAGMNEAGASSCPNSFPRRHRPVSRGHSNRLVCIATYLYYIFLLCLFFASGPIEIPWPVRPGFRSATERDPSVAKSLAESMGEWATRSSHTARKIVSPTNHHGHSCRTNQPEALFSLVR